MASLVLLGGADVDGPGASDELLFRFARANLAGLGPELQGAFGHGVALGQPGGEAAIQKGDVRIAVRDKAFDGSLREGAAVLIAVENEAAGPGELGGLDDLRGDVLGALDVELNEVIRRTDVNYHEAYLAHELGAAEAVARELRRFSLGLGTEAERHPYNKGGEDIPAFALSHFEFESPLA